MLQCCGILAKSSVAVSLLFFSTSSIALPLFKALLDDERFEVRGLICQPDRAQGRGQVLASPAIKELALARGVPVFQPERLWAEVNLLASFKEQRPDFLLTFAYGQILSKEWLELPLLAPLNIHPSLLPLYRGPTPIPAVLLNGASETGITLMRMVPEMDAGPIASQLRLSLEPGMNAEVLFEHVAQKAEEWIPDELLKLSKDLFFIPQEETGASYCSLLCKEDGYTDFKSSAQDLYRRSLAYTPWPGIWTRFAGQRLKLFGMQLGPDLDLKPGEVGLVNGGLCVGTAHGAVVVEELQLEGKKRLSARIFLEGHRDFLKVILPS